MYYTTLNKIRSKSPCCKGWEALLKHLGKKKADDEPVSLKTILESNGIDDALWCLRAVDDIDKDARLYAVWCARQVQHLMKDQRSITTIDVAAKFANGEATQDQLDAAFATGDATGDATDEAMVAVWVAVSDAAMAAAWVADAASWAAAWAAADDAKVAVAAEDTSWAARDAARDAARAAWDAARDAQTEKFIEMFCQDTGLYT